MCRNVAGAILLSVLDYGGVIYMYASASTLKPWMSFITQQLDMYLVTHTSHIIAIFISILDGLLSTYEESITGSCLITIVLLIGHHIIYPHFSEDVEPIKHVLQTGFSYSLHRKILSFESPLSDMLLHSHGIYSRS